MPKGLWIWPADPKEQDKMMKRIASAPHLVDALAAISKSEEGLSNAEVDDAINDSSEWRTLWVVRQLTSLGLIELNVDFFGNPARYHVTNQGRAVLSAITGEPTLRSLPPAQAPQAAPPPTSNAA